MSFFDGFGKALAGIALGASTGGGSLLGAVAGNVAGSLINSAIAGHTARQNMEKQMQLQKELFQYENTHKHQFEVEDLRAAGLNPILSATNGNAVGVGGVSMSNTALGDNPYSSAKQLQMMQKDVDIKQQDADSNTLNAMTSSKVGATQASLNMANQQLAEANANTAVSMLPWLEKEKETSINNMNRETEAKVGYYGALGSAALTQASAAAAEHYQNVKESLERMPGYHHTREGQRISNLEALSSHQFKVAKRDLILGRRTPNSAYEAYRAFMNPSE